MAKALKMPASRRTVKTGTKLGANDRATRHKTEPINATWHSQAECR